MKRKLLSILSLGIMLTSMLVPTMKTSASEIESMDVAIQESASNAYDELMNSFPESRATGEKIYPDYYGGSYINDEGQLVVYIKDGFAVPETLSNDDEIVYQECDYSYNELQSVMNELNLYKFSNDGNMIADNYNEFGLYDESNRVIVKLDELSKEEIDEFKENVCDSNAIVFEQGNGPAQLEVNVNAGSSVSTTSATASVGYRVKRNGTVGFITAGHFTSAGNVVYYNGTSFAKCNVSQQSGNVDGAFCSVSISNYSLTNTLSGTSNTLSTTISEPGVGTVINKIGQSTGHTSGKVTSTNVTITFSNGNTISNLTAADYSSAPGDSGCVVYSYISSSNARLTLGIHTGSNGTTRYYTKANAINAAFGTSRY